jgi:isopentenyl phosphate kinase
VQILKLGGSVVTHKDIPYTANIENIERLVKEISQTNLKELIIVHGGGSFGHPTAKKFKIQDGYSEPNQMVGFSKTRQAMIELNSLIIKEFLEESIPAVSVSPSSSMLTYNGRISKPDFRILREFIGKNFIPVLYGDAVIDTNSGFTILSGDQLVVRLAIELKADQIVIGTDVDGVYNKDPKTDPNAKLLECISLRDSKEIILSQSQTTDVTGGMAGKILEMKPAIEQGIKVFLVNANIPSRIYSALKGEQVTGTVLAR